MESENYHVENGEHYSTFSRRYHDFLGFADLVCVHKETGDVILVQSTSDSNVSSRINKITNHENLPIARKAGWGIQVHGWRKKLNRWRVRREDLS